jgi:hypothetical protein
VLRDRAVSGAGYWSLLVVDRFAPRRLPRKRRSAAGDAAVAIAVVVWAADANAGDTPLPEAGQNSCGLKGDRVVRIELAIVIGIGRRQSCRKFAAAVALKTSAIGKGSRYLILTL